MRERVHRGRLSLAIAVALMPLALTASSEQQAPSKEDETMSPEPFPVRNDVAQTGQEALVLRHQKLKPGTHQQFYEISRETVWPFFEKIGVRVVGQWQVVYPEGAGGSDAYDEGYRLARYVSYNHWEDTRSFRTMGGDGPDYQKCAAGLAAREALKLGSNGAYFLQGTTASRGPYYMPGLQEGYERVREESPAVSDEDPEPVRNDVSQVADEIVVLHRWKIRKGVFQEFNNAGTNGMWPYLEKIGARVVGEWKIIHPAASDGAESPDYDEVMGLTRFAGYAHWKAARRPVSLGGNGPDYQAYAAASRLREDLSTDSTVEFLAGYMSASGPRYMPGLGETYRPVE